jgi:MFS family permease
MRSLAGASPDAARLVAARALRGFADGFVSVWLAAYLTLLGFSAFEIGALVTVTLLGSAATTLTAGLLAHRVPARTVLFSACALMFATGVGFASLTDFWPLAVIGFAGTLNPVAGDVSVFLPTEQSLLARESRAADRAALFARYNLAGALLGAFGSLVSGLPELLARSLDVPLLVAFRTGFGIYAAGAVALYLLYTGLRPDPSPAAGAAAAPLARSRRIVLRLSALFALDSFGGGFAVQSLLALWLFLRFDLSIAAAGSFFFAAGVLAAFSQLVSARLAVRIGLIETMVFTHLPANAFLVLAAFMPSAPLAIACLLARMALSQMDVPARQAYVMAVVPPEERAAAAGVTNVPRSLGGALSPALAGAMLGLSTFGWPLVVGGLSKIAYDLLLLAQFRHLRPPDEGSA